jgi:hypothetical protein
LSLDRHRVAQVQATNDDTVLVLDPDFAGKVDPVTRRIGADAPQPMMPTPYLIYVVLKVANLGLVKMFDLML